MTQLLRLLTLVFLVSIVTYDALVSTRLLEEEKRKAYLEGRQSVYKKLTDPNCINLLGCLSEEYIKQPYMEERRD